MASGVEPVSQYSTQKKKKLTPKSESKPQNPLASELELE